MVGVGSRNTHQGVQEKSCKLMGNGVQNLVPVADPAVDCEPTPGTLGYSPGAPTEY